MTQELSNERLTTHSFIGMQRVGAVELDWRPFSTAPKDGTEFIGGWATGNHWATGTPMCWQNSEKRCGWFALSPTYENDKGEFFPGKWISNRDAPTHWHPLLAFPKLP